MVRVRVALGFLATLYGGAAMTVATGLVVTGCRSRPAQTTGKAVAVPIPAVPSSTIAAPEPNASAARDLRRCFSDRPAWSDAPVSELLDRAGSLFDRDDFTGALACAEEAARAAPRSVEAHHDRAAALLHLNRVDEARDALALALALGPDDPETLEATADLFINQLPPAADRSAIGLEHARRGFRRAAGLDRARAARLSLLEGQALIDLGRSEEAIRRLNVTLSLAPRLVAARYEKGVAEFELCRFEDARRTFQKVLDQIPEHAHALFHLGLIEERQGDEAAADRYFAEAATRDPTSFPAPPPVSPEEFAARVKAAVAALPADVRADIAESHLEASELPALRDLVAERPPLSPTILGLFRGLPLHWGADADNRPQAGRLAQGKAQRVNDRGPAPVPTGEVEAAGASCGTPERTIVLYRRNLLRSVRDSSELDEAIRRTLLHEVGHLRGEDDGSLRDRGLE